MKLENFSNLYFVVSVLVPGFIYCGVVANFVLLRRSKEKEILFLRYITATAFNYAICSPIIYLLTFGQLFADHPIREAFSWFAIIFVIPTMIAACHARMIQRDSLKWFYRILGLRPISPIPTGWDWIFSTIEPCFVLVTLKDGTEIAGYFGERSVASSDPDHKDVYIEQVYTVPGEGRPWAPVERSLGMQIDGTNIAYIEFRS